jgi:hypothetical protein
MDPFWYDAASRWPSGLNATLYTTLARPLRESNSLPEMLSLILTMLSMLPVARRRPSGLNATLQIGPEWPFKENSSWPVALSQTFAV